MKKRKLFARLSSTGQADDFDDFEDEEERAGIPERQDQTIVHTSKNEPETHGEGQLPVDVYQTANEIIIHAFVAGVRPDELSLNISRNMVEITGSRMEQEEVQGPDYFTRELFWGSFTRTILLPEEVDVEAASAASKDGLLKIILPKLDKARQTKLKVRAG